MIKELNLVKKDVLVQVFESCPDLRITGSNLYTGMKAFFHVKGRNQGYKIYMTNTEKSFSFYIKQKGKNVILKNHDIVGTLYPNKLIKFSGWYVELPNNA